VVRNQAGLDAVCQSAPAALLERDAAITTPADVLVAVLIAHAARVRCESRGGHFRSDMPQEHSSEATHVILELGRDPERSTLDDALRPRAGVAT
jgi:aspartate oxidase